MVKHGVGRNAVVGEVNSLSLHVFDGVVDQSLSLFFNSSVRNRELGNGQKSIHGALLSTCFKTSCHFALEVFFNVSLEFVDTIVNAEVFCELVVKGGKNFFVNFFQRNFELNFLAGKVLGRIVFRESQVESLGFAGFHTANRVFEFGEHSALAESESVVFSCTAFESNAVKSALEVNDNAIAVSSSLVSLFESGALFAHNVECLFDVSVCQFAFVFCNGSVFHVRNFDVREDFESSCEGHCVFIFRSAFGRSDIRVAGDVVFAFLNFFNESGRNECVDCIKLNFLTISGSDHSGRSMAGTETVEFSFLCFFAKSFSNTSIEFFTRNRQLNGALKRIRLNFFGFCFFSRSCCGFCFFLYLFFYFGFFCHLNISFPDMPEGGLFIGWRSSASLFDRRIITVNGRDTT